MIEYMAKMTKYLGSKHVAKINTGSNSTTSSCPKIQVKLPKIELPTFDGDVTQSKVQA